MKVILIASLLGLSGWSAANAQEAAELRTRMEKLEFRVGALETENNRLKAQIAELQARLANVAASNMGRGSSGAAASASSETVRCVNQMKNIGLAFRIFAVDHNDRFPFHAPAAEGGSKESVSLDANGFDRNPARHFMTISNELAMPKLLVCPSDTSKRPATAFSSLQNANVTYLVRTGPEVTENNPQAVLLKCPIHSHVALCDSTVVKQDQTGAVNRAEGRAASGVNQVSPAEGRAGCINNLQQIDGAKEQWALENRRVERPSLKKDRWVCLPISEAPPTRFALPAEPIPSAQSERTRPAPFPGTPCKWV
jgi:hypothetical protein